MHRLFVGALEDVLDRLLLLGGQTEAVAHAIEEDVVAHHPEIPGVCDLSVVVQMHAEGAGGDAGDEEREDGGDGQQAVQEVSPFGSRAQLNGSSVGAGSRAVRACSRRSGSARR